MSTFDPWPDTWTSNVEPETMIDFARKKKQECKDQWLCIMKHGRYILKLSDQERINWLDRLEKSAMSWQEEIDVHLEHLAKAVQRERALIDAKLRFKEHGWPDPLYTIGKQTELFKS